MTIGATAGPWCPRSCLSVCDCGIALGPDWRYIAVGRIALVVEETLHHGTWWAVFVPNDEPLRSQLRPNVGAFTAWLLR